jgi:hypothetical protein
VASGFPSSLDAKQIGQAEKSFEDPLTPEREIPFPPFGRLAREGKREREEIKQMLG